ncbi:Ring canal kelch-like protein [Leptotrombidium deliense]|uniref:Kelch-like protein diablo n=1 Tax=Leptotrombidium deliense TaxID=299467 RepID=A0A443S9A4_9ACAR|nr:Ring canal kelch-like protein [Leptotrombidium deliense]
MKSCASSRNVERSEKCLGVMFDMRPTLCDVTLITDDGRRISAHRVVLASALQYFNAMFTASGVSTNGCCYVESNQHEIAIKNIDGQALETIVKWCYLGSVETDEESVQELLAGAKMLDCVDIVVICSDFIKSQLHPENALGINTFAEMLGCTDLQLYSLNYIHNNFIQISSVSEFMQLSAKRLTEIISSDFIDTGESGEQAVLSSVISWINNDMDLRKQCLPSLIEHVRFPRLPQEVLVRIQDEYPLLKTDTTCKDLLIEAMKFHLCKGQLTLLTSNSRFKMRSPRGKPKCLLVVGGQAPKAIRQCEFYDFCTDQWYEIPSELPTRRCRAGVAVLNGLVYAIGGFNGSLRVRTVDCFDPQANRWISCPSMEARRSTLGVCVLNNRIYAVGGFDGSTGLQSAEVYDPISASWHFIAPMSTKRSSVGVSTLNDFIYAVGGYDGASRQCLSSVEFYNPSTDSWQLIPDMSQRRSGAGVGVLDGKLYAIGGHDGPAVRKSVECYDPQLNCWMQCADMIIARRNAGVVSRDGLLFVVGGDDGQSNLPSVEIYNPKMNSWTLLPQKMSIGRSYAGVCIIDKFWL